jgi:hypothetical protein
MFVYSAINPLVFIIAYSIFSSRFTVSLGGGDFKIDLIGNFSFFIFAYLIYFLFDISIYIEKEIIIQIPFLANIVQQHDPPEYLGFVKGGRNLGLRNRKNRSFVLKFHKSFLSSRSMPNLI